MKEHILVVEDESLMLDFLVDGLETEGFAVVRADSLAQSLAEIQRSPPSVVLADYQLRDGTAFQLLDWLKVRDLRIPLIVLTGHASVDLAVQAVKNGAEQFLTKPVDLELLTTLLRRTLDHFRVQQKDVVRSMEQTRAVHDPFIGRSPAVRELEKAARRVAEVSNTVLIQGETGTGKGVLARWLHKNGARSKEAFVDLNCAGLSHELLESELFGYQKGAFTSAANNKLGFLEAANRGTLFLDEIGEMDSQVQPKILKVVEEKRFHRLGDVYERKVDVQIIAATHRDLKVLTQENKFRTDLYFRLNTLPLRIPPLRERMEDIPLITDMLIGQLGGDVRRGPLRITDQARGELQLYSWPGNIRELRNVLERAALLSDDGLIREINLETELSSDCVAIDAVDSRDLTLRNVEKRHILEVLRVESGNVVRAAERLGVPRSTLYSKIREHGIKKGRQLRQQAGQS